MTFNPFEPGYFDDPYAQYAALRHDDPVHESPLGVWVLFRYDDCSHLLRDPSMSVEEVNAKPTLRMQMFEEFADDRRAERPRAILNLDPPDHTRLRRLVQKAFTPKMVEGLRPRAQVLVDDALDQMDRAGDTVDLIANLAFPLPFTVISEMLGMPEGEERDQVRSWAHAVVKTLDPIISPDDLRAALDAADHLGAYVEDVVRWKRDHPGDDLLTALMDVLSGGELFDQVVLLFVAGHETTVNLIGNGTHALMTHRDQWERLVADPSLVPGAVEELLRWDSPVQFSRRITLDDLEIGGRTIEKGTFVLTCLGSANRDEGHWGDDAPALDIAREGAGLHLSFGSGIHHCLGSSLARVEGQVAIGTLARRFPSMSLAGEAVRNNRIVLRGFDAVPVSLRA